MIFGALARRYARALLLLADSPAEREKFAEDMQAFAQASTSSEKEDEPTLLQVLVDERHLPSQRKRLLVTIATHLGLSATVIKFLEFVFEQGRIAAIPDIARLHNDMVDELVGRLRAQIRSAQPLSSDAIRKLQEALERATGKTLILNAEVDPELMGGLVTQIGSMVVDGSIRTALANMRSKLPSEWTE